MQVAASKRTAVTVGLPTVRAVLFIRKMRGGCQAHLISGDDGRAYVVKFINNLQVGRRGLINEYIAALCFGYLGVNTPGAALIDIGYEFLRWNPEVHLSNHDMGPCPVTPGLHFGSLYPGDPSVHSVYDFLPDAMLRNVYNLTDFFGALVLDKWLGNADGPQAIFYRALVKGPRHPVAEWVVSMIDRAHAFGGDEWTFVESDAQGVYARRIVYGEYPTIDDFEPWLDRLSSFRKDVIEDALCGLPHEWIDRDAPAAERLIKRLWRRRDRVRGLVENTIEWLQWKGRQHPKSSSPPDPTVVAPSIALKRYDAANCDRESQLP
jgi:hypothetical protein